jgi:hypothetical protein
MLVHSKTPKKSETLFFNPSQQQIMLREGMSEAQIVSAVIHEITHATTIITAR